MKITIINPKDNSPHGYDVDPSTTVSFIATAAARDFGYGIGADLFDLATDSGKALNPGAAIATACNDGGVYTLKSVGSV